MAPSSSSASLSAVRTRKNGVKKRRTRIRFGRRRIRKTANSANPNQNGAFKRLWLLPNEIWTDTLRMFSRRDLLRRVQPSCKRFHAICEWNVPSVHVIRRCDRFFALLGRNSQRSKTHTAHVSGSDASLAKHFQLTGTAEIHANIQNEMRVLRHSAELFHCCQIQIRLVPEFYRKDPLVLADRLALLNSLRPCSIEILTEFLESDQLLRHPLVMDCSHLSLIEKHCLLPSVATICQWLHHLPTEQQQQESSMTTTRVLNLNWWNLMMRHKLYELVDRCKEMHFQAKSPADRRSFVLFFRWWAGCSRPGQRLALGQYVNELTGEILRLEGHWLKIAGRNHFHYLLRRCLHSELATIGRHSLRDFLRVHETDGACFVHYQAPTKQGKCQGPVPTLKLVNLHGEETQGRHKEEGPNRSYGLIG